MIVLEVLSALGAIPDPPIRVLLGAEGGTLGRATGNALVLPDPGRSVSRVHARIQIRKTGPRLLCLGSNAVTVDGVALEQGEETPLVDGARLQIGNFLIGASLSASARALA